MFTNRRQLITKPKRAGDQRYSAAAVVGRARSSKFKNQNKNNFPLTFQDVPNKETSSDEEKEAFNPFMPSNLTPTSTECKQTAENSTSKGSVDTIPLNLSKPRRSESGLEPNNNKELELSSPTSGSNTSFEDDLNNLGKHDLRQQMN